MFVAFHSQVCFAFEYNLLKPDGQKLSSQYVLFAGNLKRICMENQILALVFYWSQKFASFVYSLLTVPKQAEHFSLSRLGVKNNSENAIEPVKGISSLTKQRPKAFF